MRLDKCVFEKFGLRSRSYAENLVKTGGVSVDGIVVAKPAFEVTDENDVCLLDTNEYASQGAYKLEESFSKFGIDVSEKICADIGCSNGGFTDCLLRHGAKSVIAVDVAECALSNELINCDKVSFVRANARNLPNDFPTVDFVCSDLSFISLTLVLPEIWKILKGDGQAVLLIKPQFELDRRALSKSGIVTDKKLRLAAVEKIHCVAIGLGFTVLGVSESPIRYKNKNVEYLIYLKKHTSQLHNSYATK